MECCIRKKKEGLIACQQKKRGEGGGWMGIAAD